MQLTIEVLPAPLGPMIENSSPSFTPKLTSVSARTPPKRSDTPRTSKACSTHSLLKGASGARGLHPLSPCSARQWSRLSQPPVTSWFTDFRIRLHGVECCGPRRCRSADGDLRALLFRLVRICPPKVGFAIEANRARPIVDPIYRRAAGEGFFEEAS